jgi:DNA topoisomerase-1
LERDLDKIAQGQGLRVLIIVSVIAPEQFPPTWMKKRFTCRLERDLDKIAQGQDTYGAVVARLHKRLEEELSQQRGMPSVPMASAPRPATAGGAFNCPKCNQPLARRQKKGDGGYDFWGCTGYRSNGCKVSFPSLNGKPDFDKPRGV